MSLKETFEKLQDFDPSDLDLSNIDINNIGIWPTPVKAIAWGLVFILVLAGAYIGIFSAEFDTLKSAEDHETSLRADFEKKVNDAANLEAYRAQMSEMEQSFEALLKQLPQDTEVPGLLDDISGKGLDSGLSFNKIDLKPEHSEDYYVELPIEISVAGGYHDFGSFVSGIASLSRIVTLEDFSIVPSVAQRGAGKKDNVDGNKGGLTMTILAKTYRYKPKESK